MENNWFLGNLPREVAKRSYDGKFNVWQKMYIDIDGEKEFRWVNVGVYDSEEEATKQVK